DAQNAFAEKECKLFTLSDYAHLLQVAEQRNTLTKDEAETLVLWRQDPKNWGI
ncbi:MAG TPA: orotate phosphoribosyltransferase, partial [Cryomorphaceae bacterium]|nr:orotate phosphoribosyltransferase [Cryomorphaceae bacterium]